MVGVVAPGTEGALVSEVTIPSGRDVCAGGCAEPAGTTTTVAAGAAGVGVVGGAVAGGAELEGGAGGAGGVGGVAGACAAPAGAAGAAPG